MWIVLVKLLKHSITELIQAWSTLRGWLHPDQRRMISEWKQNPPCYQDHSSNLLPSEAKQHHGKRKLEEHNVESKPKKGKASKVSGQQDKPVPRKPNLEVTQTIPADAKLCFKCGNYHKNPSNGCPFQNYGHPHINLDERKRWDESEPAKLYERINWWVDSLKWPSKAPTLGTISW